MYAFSGSHQTSYIATVALNVSTKYIAIFSHNGDMHLFVANTDAKSQNTLTL